MPPLVNEGVGKRALVTGLDGFTGAYLARLLREAGYRVFGTVLNPEHAGHDVFALDLCDRAAVQALIEQVAPDVVAHLAGISFVAHGNPEQIYRVNLVATRHLLEALAALPVTPSAVLLASSAHVYGNAEAEVIDESAPLQPLGDYAVSKLAMEYMAQMWATQLPLTIVRPFNYTGVGQHENFLLPKIVAHFRRRDPLIELGNLEVARDFSDVRTVAQRYRRLLALAPVGVFNVCSGVAHSLREVLAMMEAIAGYRIEVRVNPAFVRSNELLRLAGNGERLQAAIGGDRPIALADTLRWMYQA